MEIVIKIPDEMFETYKHWEKYKIATAEQTLILHGTVLPKGHGRLIDADCLNTGCGIRACDCIGDCDTCPDVIVSYSDIKNAETIIEADMGHDYENT